LPLRGEKNKKAGKNRKKRGEAIKVRKGEGQQGGEEKMHRSWTNKNALPLLGRARGKKKTQRRGEKGRKKRCQWERQ